MYTRSTVVLAALASLVLAGCGGGGLDAGAGVQPPAVETGFNEYEKQLVGTYELVNFELAEVGSESEFPVDFNRWDGALVLQEDGVATLSLRLCEPGEEVARGCDRIFHWSADAGVLRLDAIEVGGADALGAWTMGEDDLFYLQMLQPDDEPGCALFLLADGGVEDYTWQRHP